MTVYKTAAVNSGLMPDFGTPAGMVISRSVKHTLVNTMITGDSIQMLPIPKGAQIIDMILVVSGTSGSVLDVGDGNSAARFMKSVTVHTDNRVYRMNLDAGINGFLFQVTQEDTIDIVLNASDYDSAGALSLTVLYKMAGSISDESF